LRRFFDARRAAEWRLLPRPFRQAMEWRLRALERKERSREGASVEEVPWRAVWAVAQEHWKMRTLGCGAPVTSDRRMSTVCALPRAEAYSPRTAGT
jgi:hypothetical protein